MFTEVGVKAKKGSLSYDVVDVTIVDVNNWSFSLDVAVKQRDSDPTVEHVTIDLGKKNAVHSDEQNGPIRLVLSPFCV